MLLLTWAPARAQVEKDKSRALLRQDPVTTIYYVEVQLDTDVPSLKPGGASAGTPADHFTTSLRYKKQTLLRTEDVMLCAPGSRAYNNYLNMRASGADLGSREAKLKICSDREPEPWRYYFWLNGAPAASDGYAVSYDFTDSAGGTHGDSLSAVTDYAATILDSRIACKKGVVLNFDTRSAPGGAPSTDAAYLRERAMMIFSQLKVSNAVTMELEPRADGVQDQPVPAKVTWLNYLPPTAKEAGDAGGFTVCVEPEETLPAGEYHVRLNFANSPPVELLTPLTAALKSPAPVPSFKAAEIAEKDKLTARALGNNLDLGIAVTSSVNDVDKEIEGAKVKVRERQTDFVGDLIFAPEIAKRDSPPVAGKWNKFTTPFYFDAKISTGKITKDSLSVNRFIFGREWEYRKYSSTVFNERNIYRFFVRALNASDRDLKRPEAKAQIEFRPVFDAVNNPLEYEYFTTKIDPTREDKKRLKSSFGYLLQPFAGAEAGRTYRAGRTPFTNETQSRNVRRLFFGLDISLFVTEKVTLTLADTFYVRGEAPSDRGHNYFKGEINFFFNDRSTEPAQSFFVSFEKGNQPPFATKDTNAVKAGYRIRSNFIWSEIK